MKLISITYGVKRSEYSFAMISTPPARATPMYDEKFPISRPTTDYKFIRNLRTFLRKNVNSTLPF